MELKTKIIRILDKHYKKSTVSIAQQQGGWAAQAYKVDTTDSIFFLKVYEKRRMSTEILTAKIDAYMPVVLWLHDNTSLHQNIICPILTVEGNFKCQDNQFIYILFPYVEGYTLCEKPLSKTQVNELSEIISKLHKYGNEIPVNVSAIKENFEIPFADKIINLFSLPDEPKFHKTMSILKKYKTVLIKSIDKIKKTCRKTITRKFAICPLPYRCSWLESYTI